jgi:citrate synthase
MGREGKIVAKNKPENNSQDKPVYYSKIWHEVAEEDNPFSAKAIYCHGYNIVDDVLPKARFPEYLFLLFNGDRPDEAQERLMEKITIAIANPGMRDLSIRAAMNAGVGGSTAAACLIAALGVGAGQYGGAREVYTLVEQWHTNHKDIDKWRAFINNPNGIDARMSVWSKYQHIPGFDPNGNECPITVVETLNQLALEQANDCPLQWLAENRLELENIAKTALKGIQQTTKQPAEVHNDKFAPLTLTAVVAAAYYQLGFTAEQSEMLYLLQRLPGAAIHALEQKHNGWKKFPFFGKETELKDDPGPNKAGLPPLPVKDHNI